MNIQADLQVHPFLPPLGKNKIEDVLKIMEERDLNVIAAGELNSDIYAELKHQSERVPYSSYDRTGFMFQNNGQTKYIFKLREYDTKEGIQLITIGYSYSNATPKTEMRKIMDYALNSGGLVGIDHGYVDNIETKTAGDISEEKELELEKICREYGNEVYLEWNSYSNPIIRSLLKIGLNAVGKKVRYYDINKRIKDLSKRLSEEGINSPIVPDSDVHGRNYSCLKAMGISRISLNVNGSSPKEVLNSMKKQIFSGNYKTYEEYASISHILEAYCFPLVINGLSKNRIFQRPRS